MFQRKKEKEKKIRKAQEKIEKKLQRLQKNVDDMKDSNVAMKKPKSPGRPSFKSPKTKKSKSSIRIEPQLIKPLYKNKLQPKTKFKFPPKKPVVKKSTGKLSLTPTIASKFYLCFCLLFFLHVSSVYNIKRLFFPCLHDHFFPPYNEMVQAGHHFAAMVLTVPISRSFSIAGLEARSP